MLVDMYVLIKNNRQLKSLMHFISISCFPVCYFSVGPNLLNYYTNL